MPSAEPGRALANLYVTFTKAPDSRRALKPVRLRKAKRQPTDDAQRP
jgi:hypothetical protein